VLHSNISFVVNVFPCIKSFIYEAVLNTWLNIGYH